MARWIRGASRLGAIGIATTLAACGGGGGGGGDAGGTAGADAASAVGASGAAAAASGISQASVGPQAAGASAQTFEERALALVNAARATARSCGATTHPAAPPMRWDTRTVQASRAQAEYLQQNNAFSHTGANGSTVGDRLTATGYAWSTVGENIAAGHLDLPAVVQAWIDSPGHCANIMNANFVDVGIALVPGTSANTYRTYWGMVLAKPR